MKTRRFLFGNDDGDWAVLEIPSAFATPDLMFTGRQDSPIMLHVICPLGEDVDGFDHPAINAYYADHPSATRGEGDFTTTQYAIPIISQLKAFREAQYR